MLDTMLRATIIFSILVFGAVALSAQDDLAQFQPMMKAAIAAGGQMRAAFTASDTAAAATAAKNEAAAFDQMVAFWQAKHADDAVKFAESARDAAKAVAAATSIADMQAAARAINPNCGGCHAAHRSGMPGSFTIK
jgi:mono/diheme cytochrome c family protein